MSQTSKSRSRVTRAASVKSKKASKPRKTPTDETISTNERRRRLLDVLGIDHPQARRVMLNHNANLAALAAAGQITLRANAEIVVTQQELLKRSQEQVATTLLKQIPTIFKPVLGCQGQTTQYLKTIDAFLGNSKKLTDLADSARKKAFEIAQQRMSERLDILSRGKTRSKRSPSR